MTSAADEQRRAQERLDPLLPQERVEHVGVIDVLDDDRSPLGGDLAREAETHRDARPALHGLLEPARCARDELVGRLVEQKERCSVAPERLPDAGEQLVEQLVELEVCQCGIRDRLDAPELILVSPPRDVHFVGSPSENCQGTAYDGGARLPAGPAVAARYLPIGCSGRADAPMVGAAASTSPAASSMYR